MKCPLCSGKMVVKKDVMEEDGISYEYSKCVSCNEEILDGDQMHALAEKYRKFRKAKDVQFSKWGNSIAVRIPADVARECNIEPGRSGTLTNEKGYIKIVPTSR